MKKMIMLLLMVIMVLGGLTGCGSKNGDRNEEKLASSNEGSVVENQKDQGKTYKVGIILPMEHPSLNQIQESIVAELRARGYDESTVVIDFQNANGEISLLPTIYQNLISNGVDVLVPIATPTAQGAMAATTTIPIVFSAVSAPVEAGLVSSFEATTGNITGVADVIPIDEILKLALELTPNLKTIGFVYNSSEENSITNIEKAKAFCDSNGIAYKEATITSTAELQQAAQSLVGSVDALFTPNDNMVASAMPTYVQVAMDSYLPLYVGADSMVADGGLATIGIDYSYLGKQTADMVIRILEGEQIANIPVEAISDYAKIINQNVAKHLGIEITEEILNNFVIIGK